MDELLSRAAQISIAFAEAFAVEFGRTLASRLAHRLSAAIDGHGLEKKIILSMRDQAQARMNEFGRPPP